MATGDRLRAQQAVRNWNECFGVGTPVVFEGQPAKTWSHAGLGQRFEPVVFLVGVEEPVPLDRLEVPGWERTGKRKNTKPP